MRFAIWMPIMLRAASAFVFVIAVIVAGAANRSLLMVPAIAAVATLANLNTPRMSINLTGAPEQGIIGRAMSVFVTRTVLFGVVFGLSVLIAALFRETDLARDFTNFDVVLVTGPFVLALILTTIAMRSPLGNPEEFVEDLKKALSEMQTGAAPNPDNDNAFTVDGEFEERKPDDS